MTDNRRRWIYGVLVAAGAVAIGYDWIAADKLALWLALAASMLGNGLAIANVPRKGGRHTKEPDDPADE